jgi:hypothetical protein
VVVAINQVRSLITDVGEGSMRTAFDHGLSGPKGIAELEIGNLVVLTRKGYRLIFRSVCFEQVVTQQYPNT